MKESGAALFPRFYDERQSASAVALRRGGRPDAARGRHVLRARDAAASSSACGGWSRRDKLYTGSGDGADDGRRSTPRPSRRACGRCSSAPTGRGAASAGASSTRARTRRAREGFTQLSLVATMPGLPLYLACGFGRDERRRVDDARRRDDPVRRDGEADRLAPVAAQRDRGRIGCDVRREHRRERAFAAEPRPARARRGGRDGGRDARGRRGDGTRARRRRPDRLPGTPPRSLAGPRRRASPTTPRGRGRRALRRRDCLTCHTYLGSGTSSGRGAWT